jgi:hypothetical protein
VVSTAAPSTATELARLRAATAIAYNQSTTATAVAHQAVVEGAVAQATQLALRADSGSTADRSAAARSVQDVGGAQGSSGAAASRDSDAGVGLSGTDAEATLAPLRAVEAVAPQPQAEPEDGRSVTGYIVLALVLAVMAAAAVGVRRTSR